MADKNMTEFKIQGRVLSKIPCRIEREKRAQLKNKSVLEIPITYGSVRLGINILRINNTSYSIQRVISENQEERFILEISYRYDTELQDGSLIEEHQLINKIEENSILDITLDNTFTKKEHNKKIIKSPEKVITSYFTKAWADSIISVEPGRMIACNKLSVKDTINKLSNTLNRPLIFS